MNSVRPRIFIASSVEGLEMAYAIQELLEFSAECTVWDQDVFAPSSVTVNNLIKRSQNTDYGIFVFSFDDIVKIRNKEEHVIRDNVLFELGMFVGTIGISHCFIIMPRSSPNIHLPTDLTGVTPLEYDAQRRDKNFKAALGPAANQIKKAIKGFVHSNVELSDVLQKQVAESGLSSFFTSRDDYAKYRTSHSSIDKYISTAQSSITLVSITLSTGIQIDDICSVIKKKLKENPDFEVTISLLNPFQDELYMTLEPVFGTDFTSLQTRTKDALKKLLQLKKALTNHAQKRFLIKVHRTLPFGSAIILDGNSNSGKIQIETKPYKVGMRKSFAFEVINNGNSFYETLLSSYCELIKDGLTYEELQK